MSFALRRRAVLPIWKRVFEMPKLTGEFTAGIHQPRPPPERASLAASSERAEAAFCQMTASCLAVRRSVRVLVLENDGRPGAVRAALPACMTRVGQRWPFYWAYRCPNTS